MKTNQIHKALTPITLAISLLATGCAYSTDKTPLPLGLKTITKTDTQILSTTEGMTLYTFDKDQTQQSNCYAACADKWPPLITQQSFSNETFTTSKRKDGKFQLNYQGKPLYLWVGDKSPGDTTGDGIKNVWHIIKL